MRLGKGLHIVPHLTPKCNVFDEPQLPADERRPLPNVRSDHARTVSENPGTCTRMTSHPDACSTRFDVAPPRPRCLAMLVLPYTTLHHAVSCCAGPALVVHVKVRSGPVLSQAYALAFACLTPCGLSGLHNRRPAGHLVLPPRRGRGSMSTLNLALTPDPPTLL